jgi:hypothetical protein
MSAEQDDDDTKRRDDEVLQATQEAAIGIHLDAPQEQVEGCRRILEQEYDKWMNPLARQDISFPELWLTLQKASASGEYGHGKRLDLTEDDLRRWMRFKVSQLNAGALQRASQAEATRCQATIHLLVLDLAERAGLKPDAPISIDMVTGTLRDRPNDPPPPKAPVIVYTSSEPPDPDQVN